MKKILVLTIIIFTIGILVSCDTDENKDDKLLHIMDYNIRVDEEQEIEIITNITSTNLPVYQIIAGDEECITIYQNKIYGLKAGATCTVEAKLDNVSTQFDVEVINSTIDVSNLNETLFSAIEVAPLAKMQTRSDFIKGVDISSIEQVIKCGGKFYTKEGNQESIYLQLKKAEVNYLRLRLWVDPTGYDKIEYGGGNTDLLTILKIAKIANSLNFKILLNFHYSDFWADPAKQIIPKDWLGIETVEAMKKTIADYTSEVLNLFATNEIIPSMVQIGNEISNGMLTNVTSDYNNIKQESLYTAADSKISGKKGTNNFLEYLSAASSAVRNFNSKIEIMIHIDRGGNNTFCMDFFNRVKTIDYDVMGLSYYPFYHGTIQAMTNNINELAKEFNKKIVIAETSYAFTNDNHQLNSSIFKTSTNNKSWEVSPQGQATLIRDICSSLLELDNNLGYGLFYWEPGWLPVHGAGWAGSGTLATWADQALFSYDGIALPSLQVFKLLK